MNDSEKIKALQELRERYGVKLMLNLGKPNTSALEAIDDLKKANQYFFSNFEKIMDS